MNIYSLWICYGSSVPSEYMSSMTKLSHKIREVSGLDRSAILKMYSTQELCAPAAREHNFQYETFALPVTHT